MAYQEESLSPEGVPQAWQTEDFSFDLLAPAAGPTSPTAGGARGPVTRVVEDMPRVGGLPSSAKTTVLPRLAAPVAGGQAVSTATPRLIPLSSAFPGGMPLAASTSIAVESQDIGTAVAASASVAGLAAYGPLPAGGMVADSVWLQASAATQKMRLQNATERPLYSPALREIWRRVLQTAAAAPAGAEGAQWLSVRADMLEKLELFEAAWALWKEAAAQARSGQPEAMAQGWVRASLLAGQNGSQGGACALVRQQASQGMMSDFWPTAAAVCAALELPETANPAALALAIQLLPPGTIENNPALMMALNAVREDKPMKFGPWPVGSLAGALAGAYPALLSGTQVASLPDVTLRRLRESPNLPEQMRAEAASSLAGKTGWPQDGAAAWALVSQTQTEPTATWPDAQTLAWAQSSSPTAEVATRAAPHVVAAALRMNDITTASAWWPQYETAELAAEGVQRRNQAHVALLAQQALASGQPLAMNDALAAWAAGRGADGVANQRVLAVLEGLGVPVSTTLWAQMQSVADGTADTEAVNLAWQRLLNDAATRRDMPAVLAMASEGLRGQSPVNANPAVLGAVVGALRQVGLNETAQRLAAEVLVPTPEALGQRAGGRMLPLVATSPTVVPSATAPLAAPAVNVPQPAASRITRPTPPSVPVPPMLKKQAPLRVSPSTP